MKRKTDQERLLSDVLGESPEQGFHEALLGQTLRLAERRRRTRAVQRAAAALSVVMAMAAFVIWRIPRATVPTTPRIENYTLTESQPLPATSIITTRPLDSEHLIVSTKLVETIRTLPASPVYHEVDDDELLALVPQPAALVRRGPHDVQLVFVAPTTETTSAQQN